MTHLEALAQIAQGVINVVEAAGRPTEEQIPLALIEMGSPIFCGMSAIVNEERYTTDRLISARMHIVEASQGRDTPGHLNRAIKILFDMIDERTNHENMAQIPGTTL